MPQILEINRMANRIHEWGEPEQASWKKMGLTRVSSVALAAVETTSILYHSTFLLAWQLPANILKSSLAVINHIIPDAKKLHSLQHWLPGREASARKMLIIAKIIAGVASTLFFGVVFSPEINFRLHQKLGLAVDNIGIKKEKELKVRLETEAKAEAIRKDRAERFAQFQKERQAAKAAEDQEDDAIDADLAELLTLTHCT